MYFYDFINDHIYSYIIKFIIIILGMNYNILFQINGLQLCRFTFRKIFDIKKSGM